MKAKKLIQTLFIIIIVSVFVTACTTIKQPGPKYDDLKTTQEFKKFNSVEELKTFLDNARIQTNYGGFNRGVIEGRSLADSAMQALPMAEKAAGGASSYSQTNVQVKDVDEADFVKNDGKYIYTIAGNKLVILDAYPAESSKIVSKTDIKGQLQNMFVNNDRLILFTIEDSNAYTVPEYDFMPRQMYVQKTRALIYDISDRSNPELAEDYSINGYYFQSRMIGDYIYFIVKDNVNYYNRWINQPMIKSSSSRIIMPPIYYFDNAEYNYVFNTVASFNINGKENLNAKTFMIGYADNLYVSKDNMYISYQKNQPYEYYTNYNEDRFYKVVVQLLPSKVQDEIMDIKNDNGLSSSEKGSKISSIIEDMYNNMDEKDKESLINRIQDAVTEYDIKQEQEKRKTIIHKIAIKEGSIEYLAKGEVSGNLLNQFSMDENDEYLRVATTTYVYMGKSMMYNNVYVLDKDMKVVGKIEDIAPDERIYSTRFIGSKLYMVTFKNIDPLFVIDLSDPNNPEILGKLKIPGYSDYLHPYDKNHIIGIGKETEGNEWGGISTKGIKLALFDVSDVANPKLIDKYEIGQEGSDSEALHDHKAFLFDKEKNILAIPVRETKGRYYDEKYGYYNWRVWQGAYVFSISADEGFKLKGTITHSDADENSNDYWYSPNAVRRSFYMDNVLYTISTKKIKANDINNIDNEIKEIDLPYENPDYPVTIMPLGIGVTGVAESSPGISSRAK